jgi:hypothetical protein
LALKKKNHRHRRHLTFTKKDAEEAWGHRKSTASAGLRKVRVVMLILLLICMAVLAVFLWRGHKDQTVVVVPTQEAEDEVGMTFESAEKVAAAFLAEADPQKRLQWVRNAEEIRTRLSGYPDEAGSAVGEIDRVLGHKLDGGCSVTGFVVAFPSGSLRLLEVVGAPDGMKVDWDAYALYGTASWEDLLSGKAERAVVRVFCEPATERPEPFGDEGKWTGFRLSSPDLPQAVLGFAEVGKVREERMKQVILGTPRFRERFTLEIVRHEGEDEPLFEITRCMAVGWILGERDVEEEWME